MTVEEIRAKIIDLGNAFLMMRVAHMKNMPDEQLAKFEVACIEGVVELIGELTLDIKRIADSLEKSNFAGQP